MLAQKAIISAAYFSLIHKSSTEVSRPPEYASTIFIVEPTRINANRREQKSKNRKPEDGRQKSALRLPASGSRLLTSGFRPRASDFRLLTSDFHPLTRGFDVHQNVADGGESFPHPVLHLVCDLMCALDRHLPMHLDVHIDEVIVAHLADDALLHAG